MQNTFLRHWEAALGEGVVLITEGRNPAFDLKNQTFGRFLCRRLCAAHTLQEGTLRDIIFGAK